MTNYVTYLYLLTPLHTGGSTQEGNLMGIAREVHTEFPYLPASSLRGKIRSEFEREPAANQVDLRAAAARCFGQKIQAGQQPTEGNVWFADATLLFFPIASLSHHLIWITCPLWLERWNRWLVDAPLRSLIDACTQALAPSGPMTAAQQQIAAVVSTTWDAPKLYLQTALLEASNHLAKQDFQGLSTQLAPLVAAGNGLVAQLVQKLVVISNEDCAALVETGLQREVRVALKEGEKTVQGGSFRSEEAIPPEAVLFFPWGIKPARRGASAPGTVQDEAAGVRIAQAEGDALMRQKLPELLGNRLQFGGLEGLGRGWAQLCTVASEAEAAG